MSLTTVLTTGMWTKLAFKENKFFKSYRINKPMICTPSSEIERWSFSYLGTAFDYLLRMRLEYEYGDAIQGDRIWVAESAVDELSKWSEAVFNQIFSVRYEEYLSQAKRVVSMARQIEQQFLRDGKVTDALCSACFKLALLDSVIRPGKPIEIREPIPEEISDLRALYKAVPIVDFKGQQVVRNPVFGEGSSFIGGADADLIVDNCLIDIKTIKLQRFSLDHFRQLVGYYFLNSVQEDPWEIDSFAIYFSRYGHLETIPITEKLKAWLDAFRPLFFRTAASDHYGLEGWSDWQYNFGEHFPVVNELVSNALNSGLIGDRFLDDNYADEKCRWYLRTNTPTP